MKIEKVQKVVDNLHDIRMNMVYDKKFKSSIKSRIIFKKSS